MTAVAGFSYERAADVLEERRTEVAETMERCLTDTSGEPRLGSVCEARKAETIQRDVLKQRIVNKHLAFAEYDATLARPDAFSVYPSLGYWLCAYWFGTPDLNVWNRVVGSRKSASVFPGGAVYDKLSGDVYRLELALQCKKLREEPPSGNNPSEATPSSGQGARNQQADRPQLTVVAFSPSIIISEAQKVRLVNRTRQKEFANVSGFDRFIELVDYLAAAYVRLQAWKYFRAPDPVGVSYVMSQESLKGSVSQLAILGSDRYQDPSDIQKIEAVKNAMHQCRQRASAFIARGCKNKRVVILESEVMARCGLTSCVMGTHLGVVSSYPNTLSRMASQCRWLGPDEVIAEREKVDIAIQMASEDRRYSLEHWLTTDWFDNDEDMVRAYNSAARERARRELEAMPSS